MFSPYLQGIAGLVYPRVCVVCEIQLVGNEKHICTACRSTLPLTNFSQEGNNLTDQIFWGRLNVEFATSLLYFEKGSKYRNLIYKLKYKGYKDVGKFLGTLLGYYLLQNTKHQFDAIVPVPLHKIKLLKRGYNQSEIIAKACAKVINVAVFPKYVRRRKPTRTQTGYRRYERWKNVENIFSCNSNISMLGKHILIIDDILTTGATVEAVAQSILCANSTARISVATIALSYV